MVENQQNAIDEAYVVGAEEYGVTVTRLTDGQRTAFRNACLSVYEKYQPIIGEDYYSFVTGLAG